LRLLLDCAGRIQDVYEFTWEDLSSKKTPAGRSQAVIHMSAMKTGTEGTGVLEEETIKRLLLLKPDGIEKTERIFSHW
jgi:hypothetical protein